MTFMNVIMVIYSKSCIFIFLVITTFRTLFFKNTESR